MHLLLIGYTILVILNKPHYLIRKGFPARFAEMDMNVKGGIPYPLHKVGLRVQRGGGEKSTEDFWVKSERLFYTALIGYIWYEAPEDEKNFTTLLEMINASEAREDDAEIQSPVDEMFARLAEKEPEHFAVRQY